MYFMVLLVNGRVTLQSVGAMNMEMIITQQTISKCVDLQKQVRIWTWQLACTEKIMPELIIW